MLEPSLIKGIGNALLGLSLVLAVVSDVRSRRIPNKVVVPAALVGIGLNVVGHGWSGLGQSLGGLVVGMGLLMPVWMAGGTGAGDVKLLGMVGAIGGVQLVVWSGLFGAIAGGVLALLALAVRGGGVPVLRNVGSYLYRAAVLRAPGEVQPAAESFRMSYAIAIALGALAASLRG